MTPGRTMHSMFEALFDQGLEPAGTFADALVDAGYVASRPELAYPSALWKRSLEIAHQHAFPDAPVREAYRELGRVCGRGWFATPFGSIFEEILPVLPLRAFLRRLPAYGRLGRNDTTVEVLEALEDRFSFRHVDPLGIDGGFTLGAIEPVVERMSSRYETLIEGTPFDHTVSLRWWK